jgi:hypothetical protein
VEPVEPVEPIESAPNPTPKSPKQEQETQQYQEVQDLCLDMLRFDRSRKPELKACFSHFNNAQKLQDIALADLPALKAKLLKLKDQR